MVVSVNNSSRRPAQKKLEPKRVRRVKNVWNKAVFDTLVSHIGVEKMDVSLQMFLEALPPKALMLDDSETDFKRQRSEVHDLASVSGFLGFEELFQACIAFLASKRSSVLCREAVASEIKIVLQELRPYFAGASRTN